MSILAVNPAKFISHAGKLHVDLAALLCLVSLPSGTGDLQAGTTGQYDQMQCFTWSDLEMAYISSTAHPIAQHSVTWP